MQKIALFSTTIVFFWFAFGFLLPLLYLPIFAAPAPNTNVNEALGLIEEPQANTAVQSASGGEGSIPIYPFISWGLSIFTIVAGIWALFNFVFAAFTYFGGSGDPGSHQKVRTHLTNTVLGLLIIVLAYTIAAIASTLIFGSPTYFFNPQLPGIV